MRNQLKTALTAVLLLAALGYTLWENRFFAGQNQTPKSQSASGEFDFYVLALSWSPSFCAEQGGDDDGQQCNANRPFAFVLHGLWPQFERGFPATCQSNYGTRIDAGIAENMLDIMPSRGLVFHQWRKHGTCSGLSPDAYFDLARAAKTKVSIPGQFSKLANYTIVSPAEIEQAFLKANQGLQENAIAVTCSNRYLREVRICMDRKLEFRACAEVDSRSCRADKTAMPPVRS